MVSPAPGTVPFAPYRLQRTLVGHAGSVAAVKFSPDGQWLATASADATCRVWRVSDGHCVAVLSGHAGGLSDVCWSAGSDFVATASDDKTLVLWRLPAGERVLSYTGHTAFVFCCCFNPQSNVLASGSFDETVRLWEARSGKCLAILPAHSDPVTSVAFSHDGTLLVSASYDGLVRLWNPLDGACMKTLVQEDAPPVSCARFSPNSRYLLLSTLDNTLRVWDFVTNVCARSYSGHSSQQFCCFAAFGVHDSTVFVGGEDRGVHVWDLQSGRHLQALEGVPVPDGDAAPATEAPGTGVPPCDGHCDVVCALDVNPRRRLVATGALDKDRTVKLWTAETAAEAAAAAKAA